MVNTPQSNLRKISLTSRWQLIEGRPKLAHRSAKGCSMFELITSILVIYVIGSILRRDGERKREVARLQARIAELHRIVTSSKGPGEADPERLIQWELHDLQ